MSARRARRVRICLSLVLVLIALLVAGCKSSLPPSSRSAASAPALCCASGVDLSLTRAGFFEMYQRAIERPTSSALLNAAWDGMLANAKSQGVNTNGAERPRFAGSPVTDFDALSSAFNHLLADHRGPFDATQVNYAALDRMARSLGDSHTQFLSPDLLFRQNQRDAGNLGTTTGIFLEQVTESPPEIVEVVPGSAADEAGVRAGDRLLAIDGRSIDTFQPRDALHALEGVDGTHLVLEIRRPGSARLRQITVIRRTMALDLVRSTTLPGNIGYIRIREFPANVPIERQVEQALGDFQYEHASGVIIDLRGNPGGEIGRLQRVLGDFVSQSPIGWVAGRDGAQQPMPRAGTLKWNQRFVVLVDGGSASSSEIFSATAQEYHDGLIVGTRTCGCLMGALFIPLLPDARRSPGLELSIERVFTPVKRQEVEGHGVTPDAVVPADPRLLAEGRDPQLEAALIALGVDERTARTVSPAMIEPAP